MCFLYLVPFVFFLESALKLNQNFFVVSVDPQSTMKKVVGEKKANPHLIKLYEVYAKQLGIAVYSFDPTVSEQERHKASHSHAHGPSHSHSHEHTSQVAAQRTESLPNTEVKASGGPAVDPIFENKIFLDAQLNSTGEQNNPSSAEEAGKPLGVLNKADLLAETKQLETQAGGTQQPMTQFAATPSVVAVNSTLLEGDKMKETMADKIPPSEENQKADTIRQEQVSSPPKSTVKVAEDASPTPSSPAGNEQTVDPTTHTVQIAEKEPASPALQEQPPVSTTPVPPHSLSADQIPVTPSNVTPVEDFLHRKVSSTDNVAKVGSHEPEEEIFPAPTPTIHPDTSTFPPGGRTASPQENIGELIQDISNLIGKVEDSKEASKVEEKVVEPLVHNNEQIELANDAGTQKTISQVVAEGSPPIAVKPQSQTTNIDRLPIQQANIQQTNMPPPLQQKSAEEKKAENVPQDPMHYALKEEQQAVATEPLGESMMKTERITKESYCHKEDCGNFEHFLTGNDTASSNSFNLLAVRSVLREFVDPLREMLPYPVSQFDLTGIFVLAFLIVSFVLHIINMCCFYETGRDVVDHKLLHDCMTRLKEQEIALKKFQADSVHYQKLSRAGAAAEKLHQEKQKLELELNSLKKEYSELHHKHNELNKLHQKIQQGLEAKTCDMADAMATVEHRDAEIEQLKGTLQILQSRNEVIANELTAAKKELEQQKHEYDTLQSSFKDSQLDVERLSHKWQCSEEELSRQKNRNEELQTEVDEFINIIRELKLSEQKAASSSRKSTPPSMPSQQGADLDNSLEQEENGGSNGSRSGGWSDLGDDTPGNGDEEADDTTMTSSGARADARVSKSLSSSSKTMSRRTLLSSELLELAHLKGEIRKMEAERDTLRFSLENEQKEKEGLSQRLEQLKQDLADKRKEAEHRESERHDLQSQCTKLLHMVDERDRKVEHIEEDREKLRAKICKVEMDWRQAEDDKRELAIKVKDLEQSLRRSEELNGKLENKIYHEERKLNAKIKMLEQQLNKAQTSVTPHNSGLGDLNMSGNSSDRDFGPRLPLEVPSLWSDVEGPEMQFENVIYDMNRRSGGGAAGSSLRHKNGHRKRDSQRDSPALSNNNNNNRTHGSSPFELEQIFANKSNSNNSTMNPTGNDKRAPRTRSRSTGRNSARLVGVDPGFSLDIKRSLLQK